MVTNFTQIKTIEKLTIFSLRFHFIDSHQGIYCFSFEILDGNSFDLLPFATMLNVLTKAKEPRRNKNNKNESLIVRSVSFFALFS